MSISTLSILLIALLAAALPYIFRSFNWNRFMKYINSEQYEQALEISNTRLFNILFGDVNQKWNQLKIYMQLKDERKIENTTNELFTMKLSKKQRIQISNSVYFYFLDIENKDMSKKVLDQLRISLDSDENIYNEILYCTLIEKKSEDINTIQSLLEKSVKNSKEEGLLEYLLGLQYLYKNDTKEAMIHLNRAKNNLKGTPYHNKIKKIISRKGE